MIRAASSLERLERTSATSDSRFSGGSHTARKVSTSRQPRRSRGPVTMRSMSSAGFTGTDIVSAKSAALPPSK